MHRALAILALLFATAGASPATAKDPVPTGTHSACPGTYVTNAVASQLPGFKCEEVERGTRSGVPYRVVVAEGTTVALLSPYRERIRDVVQRTFQIWRGARQIETHSLTFVLLPGGLPVPAAMKDIEAGAQFTPGAANEHQECIVIVNPAQIEANAAKQKATTNLPDYFGLTVGHEMAHCVQYWNALDQSRLKAGEWWKEGTAELLGAVAYPGAIDIFNRRYATFRATISKTGLIHQGYNSVPFFQWVWNQGHGKIFDLIESMPTQAGDGELTQQKALIAFLGKSLGGEGGAQIQRFAQDYVNNDIPNAAGAPMGPPAKAATQVVSGDAIVPIGGLPLTIQTRDVTFSGGNYIVTELDMLQSARARLAAFGSEWDDLPLKIEPGCDSQDVYKLAYIPLSTTAAKARYSIKQSKTCKKTPLSGASGGGCIVGRWLADNAAFAGNLGSKMGNDAKLEGVSGTITYQFDSSGSGQMTANAFTSRVTILKPASAKVNVAATGQDNGNWSASGDTLSWTSKGGSMAVKISVQVMGFSNTQNQSFLMESGQYRFMCQGDDMTLTYVGPRHIPADHTPKFELHRQP